MEIMRDMDPEGVECRRKRRIRRQKYTSSWPNYICHIDGYDKLKPYGLCIHGCIDGYSRIFILWLECLSTKNDPKVIASYYLSNIKAVKHLPRVVRADLGTENSLVELLQKYFRNEDTDEMAGHKSFLYGKSTLNQRIESWWSMYKRLNGHWWISMFKD